MGLRPTSVVTPNQAPRFFTTGRDRRAPERVVATDIGMPTQANPFEALANALGTVSGVAAKIGAEEAAIRRQEEIDKLSSQGELDGATGVVNPELDKKREYRKTRERTSAVLAGTKAIEGLQLEVAEFQRTNPTAKPTEFSEWLDGKINGLLKDTEGNPTALMGEPKAAAAIIQNAAAMRSKLLVAYQADHDKMVLEDNVTGINSAFMATAKETPAAITGSVWEQQKTALQGQGLVGADLNKRLAELAMSAAVATGNPALIDNIPDRWADGTPTFKLTADWADNLASTRDTVARTEKAKRLEGLEGARALFLNTMNIQADRGVAPTASQISKAAELGISIDTTMVGIANSARSTRQSIADRAERAAEKAAEKREKLEMLGTPVGFLMSTPKDQKDYMAADWSRAKTYADQSAVLDKYARLGKLPPQVEADVTNIGNLRTQPTFQAWRNWMDRIKTEAPTAYAGLPADVRARHRSATMLANAKVPAAEIRKQMFEVRPDLVSAIPVADRNKTVKGIKADFDVASSPRASRMVDTLFETYVSLGHSAGEADKLVREHVEQDMVNIGGTLFSRQVLPDEDAHDYLREKAAPSLGVAAADVRLFEDPDTARLGVIVRGEVAPRMYLDSAKVSGWIAEARRSDAMKKPETSVLTRIVRPVAEAARRTGGAGLPPL